MKVPAIFKISIVLLGLGGILVMAPSARGQSEVSPDHFDGTDSWEIALAAQAKAAGPKASGMVVAKQQGPKAVTVAQPVELVTVQQKQRIPAAKPKDQKKQ